MKKAFGTLPTGETAYTYTISNGIITAEISDYGATLVRLFVPDKNGRLADVVLGYEDVNGYAVFINRQGDAVITSYKSYEYYDGLLAEFGGKGDFYLNLAGMGKYANGKGFFFNGTATALDNRAQNDVADRPTRVRFDLPKNGPVYNELQNTKKFYNHKIVTLWLQDFAPRIHRIAALMSK